MTTPQEAIRKALEQLERCRRHPHVNGSLADLNAAIDALAALSQQAAQEPKLAGYFAFNKDWNIWEQVNESCKDDDDVAALYAAPAKPAEPEKWAQIIKAAATLAHELGEINDDALHERLMQQVRVIADALPSAVEAEQQGGNVKPDFTIRAGQQAPAITEQAPNPIIEWLSSDVGKEAMRQSGERVQAAWRELTRARRVDPAMLLTPIGSEQAPAGEAPEWKPTVEEVMDAIGVGPAAWDCVDPKELITAILRLSAAPAAPDAKPTEQP